MRAYLPIQRTSIGPYDALIAGQARARISAYTALSRMKVY